MNRPAAAIATDLTGDATPTARTSPAPRCRSAANCGAGQDTLGFTNQNGISGSYDACTGC